MKDYDARRSRRGPRQRRLNIGYVATPDVRVAEALRGVANGMCCDLNGEKQRAIDVVTNSMSRTPWVGPLMTRGYHQ